MEVDRHSDGYKLIVVLRSTPGKKPSDEIDFALFLTFSLIAFPRSGSFSPLVSVSGGLRWVAGELVVR